MYFRDSARCIEGAQQGISLMIEEVNEQVNEYSFPVDENAAFCLTLKHYNALWSRGQWVDFVGMYWFTNV